MHTRKKWQILGHEKNIVALIVIRIQDLSVTFECSKWEVRGTNTIFYYCEIIQFMNNFNLRFWVYFLSTIINSLSRNNPDFNPKGPK